VTPTVRHGHIKLANGATALLLGDAHATVDPLLGQGGNMASCAAHLLGQQIVSADSSRSRRRWSRTSTRST